MLEIRDSNGSLVDRINGSTRKGINRISWSLSKPIVTGLSSSSRSGRGGYYYDPSLPVKEGQYTVSLFEVNNGSFNKLTESKTFNIKKIRKNVLNNPVESQIDDFIEKLVSIETESRLVLDEFSKSKKLFANFDRATRYIENIDSELIMEISNLYDEMNSIDVLIGGNKSKKEIGEKDNPSFSDRLMFAKRGFYGNSYGPTKHQLESFEIGVKQWNQMKPKIEIFSKSVNAIKARLESLGSPYIID